VRRGLVGDDVGRPTTRDQLGEDVGAVGHEPDGQGPTGRLRRLTAGDGVVEVVGDLVEVPVVDPTLRVPRVDLHAQRDTTVAGDRERLGATHAPEPTSQCDRAAQTAAEVLVRHLGERRERALQDSLGPDVDPRARSHLPVHDQPEVFEVAEVLRCGPLGDQQRVRDQHAWSTLVGAQDPHRLAALNQQ